MTTDRAIQRIGIFSDIHGNLQALDMILRVLTENEQVDQLYCCGDIVGYGGNPNECCERIRSIDCPTVAGNHDHAALAMTDISYFNEIAKTAIRWTGEVLKPENVEYLRSLPMQIEDEEVLIVHASPKEPEAWNYILTLGDARMNFEFFKHKVCFIGHSHQPFIIEYSEGSLSCPSDPRVAVVDDRRYLVNVGSVGQPRDGNPDACYALYDRAEKYIEIKRITYDLDGAKQAILGNNLPQQLADRLNHGW
jgi:diadenosine tetraphosphatase ApaH/serine/threonine PP2A family protein phosphatase